MQAAQLTLLLLVAGSWTRAKLAGGKWRLPAVAGERLRDPTAGAAGRERRGVNVRLVAAVGPPLYLTQAEYGLGYGRVQRADAVHVQAEGDDDSDQLVDVEESPLRGGAMWALARFLLFSFMCTLATGLAVCFAKQITATYRALRTFCCLCVGRVGRGGDSEKADKPATASKPTPNNDDAERVPAAVLNRTAEGVGDISDTTNGPKVPKGNRASTDFGLPSDAGSAGRPRPLRGHRESGGVVSSVGVKPRTSQDGTSVGSRDPSLRPPPASRLSARTFSRADLASKAARRQAGTSPPARASPRMTSLRPAKSKPPRRSARPNRLEDTVDLLCLSASASSQETLFDARLGRGRGGH